MSKCCVLPFFILLNHNLSFRNFDRGDPFEFSISKAGVECCVNNRVRVVIEINVGFNERKLHGFVRVAKGVIISLRDDLCCEIRTIA